MNFWKFITTALTIQSAYSLSIEEESHSLILSTNTQSFILTPETNPRTQENKNILKLQNIRVYTPEYHTEYLAAKTELLKYHKLAKGFATIDLAYLAYHIDNEALNTIKNKIVTELRDQDFTTECQSRIIYFTSSAEGKKNIDRMIAMEESNAQLSKEANYYLALLEKQVSHPDKSASQEALKKFYHNLHDVQKTRFYLYNLLGENSLIPERDRVFYSLTTALSFHDFATGHNKEDILIAFYPWLKEHIKTIIDLDDEYNDIIDSVFNEVQRITLSYNDEDKVEFKIKTSIRQAPQEAKVLAEQKVTNFFSLLMNAMLNIARDHDSSVWTIEGEPYHQYPEVGTQIKQMMETELTELQNLLRNPHHLYTSGLSGMSV